MSRIVETANMMINRKTFEDEIQIDGYVHFDVDFRYGENADYKLGQSQMFIEDVTDVKGYLFTGEEIALTKEEEQEAKEILGRKVLEG